MPLQDCLVNLCFQRVRFVGDRVERSKERRGTREVALPLCNRRLEREGIHGVRYDIKKPIKLSQRFRKTTKQDIGKRVLGEEVNVARVESFGFVEVRLAPVPLTLPPCDISQ